MAHFLIHRHMDVYFSCRSDFLIRQVFGKAQQNAHAELVVQEAALEIPGGGPPGPGVKADVISHFNAQLPGLLGGGHVLVQHHLHAAIFPLGLAVAAVDVNRGVAQLEGAFDGFSFTGVNGDILRFAVFRPHSADGGQFQTAVGFDPADHAAQGVGVGFQEKSLTFPAQAGQNSAFSGDFRGKSQIFKGLLHPLGSPSGKAGGRVDGQQGRCLFPGKICVIAINHIVLLKSGSARRRQLPA